MEFIYLAQTQTGNYERLSVSNILSSSTQSFGPETERICFTPKTGIDEVIPHMPVVVVFFFLPSSDKAISRGAVNLRDFKFAYGQISGLDYWDC